MSALTIHKKPEQYIVLRSSLMLTLYEKTAILKPQDSDIRGGLDCFSDFHFWCFHHGKSTNPTFWLTCVSLHFRNHRARGWRVKWLLFKNCSHLNEREQSWVYVHFLSFPSCFIVSIYSSCTSRWVLVGFTLTWRGVCISHGIFKGRVLTLDVN